MRPITQSLFVNGEALLQPCEMQCWILQLCLCFSVARSTCQPYLIDVELKRGDVGVRLNFGSLGIVTVIPWSLVLVLHSFEFYIWSTIEGQKFAVFPFFLRFYPLQASSLPLIITPTSLSPNTYHPATKYFTTQPVVFLTILSTTCVVLIPAVGRIQFSKLLNSQRTALHSFLKYIL